MKVPFDIDSIDDAVLAALRLQTDPLADDAVQSIITSGLEEKINQVMASLFRNSTFEKGMFSEFGPALSKILDDYIEKSSKLPIWADAAKIKEGEKVFSLFGPEIFMLLNVSSLPLCYTCAKGAQVLFDTGRLLSHNDNTDPLARRLMETAQMIVNVMAEGGLAASGAGVVTTQKIRLIHASIRYYLKAGQYKGKAWNVKEFGEPINQEDLAGTLMSFGPVILSGLKRLDVNLSKDQSDAYMHCWKVVGYLMGVDEKLLPDSYKDGFDLATKILKHQATESDAGVALADSCVKFMQHLVPGNAFDDVPKFMMHYFLEDFSNSSGVDLSKCIGISNREDLRDKLALELAKFFIGKFSHLEEHKFVQKITSHFNRRLLEGIIHHFNGGKGVSFFIPPSLQKDWGLQDQWKDHMTLTPNIFGNRLEWQKKS